MENAELMPMSFDRAFGSALAGQHGGFGKQTSDVDGLFFRSPKVPLRISEIRVAEIVSAINEQVDATRCGGDKNCAKDSRCLTHYLWEDLSDRIHEFLSGITLGDLVDQPGVQEVACRQNEMGRIRTA